MKKKAFKLNNQKSMLCFETIVVQCIIFPVRIKIVNPVGKLMLYHKSKL